jgi:GDP-L-fucose synthase
MPTDLYGVNDNFHPENSHVIPALIRRFHEAKLINAPVVKVWGTGEPMREFLYVDEMAEASIFVMNLDEVSYERESQPMLSHINVGTGIDCTIKELTEIVAKVIGYKGKIEWDTNKPDGTPRKLMDVSRLECLGWKAKISLEDGLAKTYAWFLDNQDSFRGELA